MEKVLVTGATGYIGLHCIHQLLNQGYAVNGSVRSPERKDEIVNALQGHNTSTEHLNLFTLNLTEDTGWDEAMEGCDFLLHVASPISLERTDEDYFVQPAIDGVKRALLFAKKYNIKKVVLTSSVAAIFDSLEKKDVYDESDWSDTDNPHISAYSKSKTLAERAAWEFWKTEDHPFDLAVINPALVVGASISGDIGESNKAVQMVASGKMPVAVPLMFGYVDVRDVAAAHILAMQNPASNGERFALVEKDLWYKDVAKVLKENGFDKAPTIGIPVWLAKILANFNKELKLTLPYLGRKRSIKNTKAREKLGWNPRPAEESILDIANQMKDLGMLK
ncbi:aldehyde reductase [Gammaproteobacteria bacterium]|nr:aldehyde reductase [Gammaproteobacteria bacterium]